MFISEHLSPLQASVVSAFGHHCGPQHLCFCWWPVSAHRHLWHAESCCQYHHHPQRLRRWGGQEVPCCLVSSFPVCGIWIITLWVKLGEVLFCWNGHLLLQLWNKPEDQRDQLCDGTRLPWLRLLHQQPPEPQDHLTAHQVSGHHHALCEEPARGEHKPQSSSGSRSSRPEIHTQSTFIINNLLVIYSLLSAHSILSGFALVDQATSGTGKSKKGSTQQSSRPGESNTDQRHQRAPSSRSQPLNLSQVTAFKCSWCLLSSWAYKDSASVLIQTLVSLPQCPITLQVCWG